MDNEDPSFCADNEIETVIGSGVEIDSGNVSVLDFLETLHVDFYDFTKFNLFAFHRADFSLKL